MFYIINKSGIMYCNHNCSYIDQDLTTTYYKHRAKFGVMMTNQGGLETLVYELVHTDKPTVNKNAFAFPPDQTHAECFEGPFVVNKTQSCICVAFCCVSRDRQAGNRNTSNFLAIRSQLFTKKHRC